MPAAAGKIYVLGDVEIDTARAMIRRAGEERSLRPKTFRLLIYLVENRERLVPKQELIEQLWQGVAVSDGALAQCIADIRRALDEDARNPRFIRTAARLGYQFMAPVQEMRSETVIFEEITEERVEYSEETLSDDVIDIEPLPRTHLLLPAPRRSWRKIAIISGIIAAIFLVMFGVWRYRINSPLVATDPRIRTAILQFENRSGTPDLDWLGVGLPDMLATSLSASPHIALITPGQLKSRSVKSGPAESSHDSALRAARQTGASAMISGAFAALGDTIRLDIQIYDVSSGRLLGGESVTVNNGGLLLSQVDPLAAKLASRLGAPLTGQTRLAEVMTNNLEAYRLYSLGLARTREFRLPEAIALYENAIRLDPNFAMAYARIGYTYSSTWARPADGKPYLEKAFRLSDRLTSRDRLFIRGWYAMACQDYEGAERSYREILTAFPMEIEVYQALGTLLAGDGRYNEARQIYERGLAIDPDMPQLHNMLSQVLFELGENDKALASAQRYLALSNEPNAYDTLGTAYLRLGRHDEARAAYAEAIRRKPDFEIAIIHLGNLYFQLGRYRDALHQYEEYVRLAPSNGERVRGHVSASWVYRRKGDFSSAAREAAEATSLNANRMLREIFLLEADRGKLKFTPELRRQIISDPMVSRGARGSERIPYYIAGYIALRSRNDKEALDDFRTALKQTSTYWYIEPLETCLADAFLELGRADEAIAEYRRILSVNPNYPMARYGLGLALERKGMKREARAEFQHFLKIWKDADPDVPELIEARRRTAT